MQGTSQARELHETRDAGHGIGITIGLYTGRYPYVIMLHVDGRAKGCPVLMYTSVVLQTADDM